MLDYYGPQKLRIGVIGTGISGMSAAWLLSQKHDVTVFEKDNRIGGHSNTFDHYGVGIDTGFIVYNDKNYPNLVALFDHLGVASQETDMSFGVSVSNGEFEYSGSDLAGLLAQKRNVLRPRFWGMMRDILRFYRESAKDLRHPESETMTLGEYLSQNDYSQAFQQDHLLPMGAAIWSTPVEEMLNYPLKAFVQFCDNHGLLQISERPQWRTVLGGSRAYVEKITAPYRHQIQKRCAITKIWSEGPYVVVQDRYGVQNCFDHVILACHADQALAMLTDALPQEKYLLGAFRYQKNRAILHTDASLMPRAKRAWSSWNYIREDQSGQQDVCVTYWMNKLQNLQADRDYFVTLNPTHEPAENTVIRSFDYEHPLFDHKAISAQKGLWSLQGRRGLWFCGSYFGHGFHEDGLQSGLAVAEAVGGMRRPWQVPNENGRLHLPEHPFVWSEGESVYDVRAAE